ncbi:MAG TPA: hypothetical protein VFB99_21500 [Vicinamibacterales bacterium]|nr:hypothetical protein [Vicinamibacterales bacterium]
MMLALLLVGLIFMAVLYPAASVRSRRVVAPTITVAPVLSWTFASGSSPAVTAPTYTGSPGTITYTLKRDGSPVGGLTDVDEATIEAHVRADPDCGPDVIITAEVTNAAGSDTADSNTVAYYPDADFRDVWDLAVGVTTADGGTTVDSIADQGPGNITITTTGSSQRPAFNASDAGFNNEPSCTFDGSADELTNADIDLNAALTSGSVFAVMRTDGAGSSTAATLASIINSNSLRLRQNGTTIRRWTSAASAVNSDIGSYVVGDEIVHGGTWVGGSTQSCYVDSATAGDTDTPVLASIADPQAIWVGTVSGASDFAAATLALLVFDPTEVSSDKRAGLIAYCNYRFGVA